MDAMTSLHVFYKIVSNVTCRTLSLTVGVGIEMNMFLDFAKMGKMLHVYTLILITFWLGLGML